MRIVHPVKYILSFYSAAYCFKLYNFIYSKIDAEVDNDIEWIASICSKNLNLEILQFIYELSVQLWHSLMLVCYVWVTEV